MEHWLVPQIAAELDSISATSAQLEKRIERMLRACPVEIKVMIEATSLGVECEYAKDAAFLAELISEQAEAS